MNHPYSITAVKRTATGRFIYGELYEHDVMIACISRSAGPWPYKAHFFSSQSEARFDDFCDSLSRSETIEALMPAVIK